VKDFTLPSILGVVFYSINEWKNMCKNLAVFVMVLLEVLRSLSVLTIATSPQQIDFLIQVALSAIHGWWLRHSDV